MAGKVVGIGGVFFKCRDPDRLRDWYAHVLGIDIAPEGYANFGPAQVASVPGSMLVLSMMPEASSYFDPSPQRFMINFIVNDLDAVLERAANAGVAPLWRDDKDPNGRFAHLIDPEEIKIELWEPRKP